MFKLFRVYMRNSFCFGVGEEGWVAHKNNDETSFVQESSFFAFELSS
jgi:hypothetical protein